MIVAVDPTNLAVANSSNVAATNMAENSLDVTNGGGIINEIEGLANQSNASFNFLNSVMTAQRTDWSGTQLLDIQHRVEDFNIATQVVGKTVSTLIKDVDSLVRMQ